MAARTTGKPKQASSRRSPSKSLVAKKTATTKRAASKTRATKSAAAKKPRPAKAATSKAGKGNMETQLLMDQNEALRAALEQAQARVTHLEELNKNVVNRIDWVIDSLQSALKR